MRPRDVLNALEIAIFAMCFITAVCRAEYTYNAKPSFVRQVQYQASRTKAVVPRSVFHASTTILRSITRPRLYSLELYVCGSSQCTHIFFFLQTRTTTPKSDHTFKQDEHINTHNHHHQPTSSPHRRSQTQVPTTPHSLSKPAHQHLNLVRLQLALTLFRTSASQLNNQQSKWAVLLQLPAVSALCRAALPQSPVVSASSKAAPRQSPAVCALSRAAPLPSPAVSAYSSGSTASLACASSSATSKRSHPT